MRIEFWGALARAWGRMKLLLFRPLDARRWLVLSFCAWVAALLDGSGGGPKGGGVKWSPGSHGGRVDPTAAADALREAWTQIVAGWHWVLGHWGATLVLFLGLPLLVALILVLVWVTSRFKLIYLDNVVRGRAEVVEPWTRLGSLGDSLFAFRVGFGLATLAAGGALFALLATLGFVSFASGLRGLSLTSLAVAGLVFLGFVVVVAYISLFLRAFVVPIMYRHNLSAMAAWRAFLPWLSADPASFVLYGLFVLLLFLLAAVTVVAFGLSTCCLGFVILWIPFLGTVLLLPFLVTYRYLSLEFLAQFDPDLNVFAAPAELRS
jgi:hypothetical protein